MKEQPVSVLQISLGGEDFTGVCAYLLQYYEKLRHERVRFDFLFCWGDPLRSRRDDAALRDARIHLLHAERRKGFFAQLVEIFRHLRKILAEQTYDVIEINTSTISLLLVLILGTLPRGKTVLIAHAHNMNSAGLPDTEGNTRMQRLSQKTAAYCRHLVVHSCDYLFACSLEAGRCTFGRQAVTTGKYRTVRNAIDTQRYRYDPERARRMRASLQIADGTFVVGHVGRLSALKNHPFLLSIFREIHARVPDSLLLLIGQGSDWERIARLIEELGLRDAVRMLGERADIPDCMQAMDVFLFPSLHEGLGIAAIEAQAAGLPTFLSDGVPDEAMVTSLATKLSLREEPEQWAERIIASRAVDRARHAGEILSSGFDITENAQWLEQFYCDCRRAKNSQ